MRPNTVQTLVFLPVHAKTFSFKTDYRKPVFTGPPQFTFPSKIKRQFSFMELLSENTEVLCSVIFKIGTSVQISLS